MYPEYAIIEGKEYKINTDYKVALKCFEVVNDETIHDYERALAIVYLLFDVIPKTDNELDLFLEKATKFLECGRKSNSKDEPDMDFQQDAGYIMSSFMSDYQININQTNMHFWQYIDLIEGLTESCVLNRIRDLRNFDISEIKDSKKRNEIIEAKKRVALKTNKHTKKQNELTNKICKLYGLERK